MDAHTAAPGPTEAQHEIIGQARAVAAADDTAARCPASPAASPSPRGGCTWTWCSTAARSATRRRSRRSGRCSTGPASCCRPTRLPWPGRLAIRTSLPPLTASRDSVIRFDQLVAADLITRGRALADRTGARWPADYEQATTAYLRRSLGVRFGPAQAVPT